MYGLLVFQRLKILVFVSVLTLLCCVFMTHVLSADDLSSIRSNSEARCSYVYLPVLSDNPINYLESFSEQEPNDIEAQANGIHFNEEYIGYPGPIDLYDRYVFDLAVTITITTKVTNHDAQAGQLILRDANLSLLDYVYNTPDHLMIFPNLPPGRYYLSVLTNTALPHNSTTSYTLQVLTPPMPILPIAKTYTPVFDGDKIDANHNLEKARTNTVTLRIPPGNYKITLHSSDDHNNGQIQEQERWYLEFLDQAGDLITQTNPTEDLPDNRNCQFDVVHDTDNGLTITEEVYAVRGMHLVHPNEKPESVRPERAIIEQILP